MTKTLKKSLALILSVIMLMSVMPMSLSLAATEDGFVYEVEDEKATIIGYNGSETDIVIPETLGGYPVVAIGVMKDLAFGHDNLMPFHSNATITSVVLPSSIKYIGYGAFYKCTALVSVSLGAGLEVIDEGAFRNCSSIESILLGWNLTTIGVNSFKGCSSLSWLDIGTKLSSVGKDAFADCASSMTIKYEGTSEQWDNISFDSGNENVKESEYITFYDGNACGIYGHPTEKTPAKEPTCTEAGNIEYYTCEVCGEIFADGIEDGDDVIIPALGHDAPEPLYSPPTCTKKGYYWMTACTVCGEQVSDVVEIPALGHNYEQINYKAPTCDESAEIQTGYYYGVCSVCGDIDEYEIPAPDGHSYDVWTESEESPATCVNPGTERSSCTVCGKIGEKKGEINPNKHTELVPTEATPDTCETNGNIAYWTCAGCHKLYDDEDATNEITTVDIVIGAKGHAYGDFVYDEATGEHKRICAKDANHVESEACVDVATDIDCNCDKCGHLVAHSWTDATCTAPKTCTVCNKTEGVAKGHAFNIWEHDAETGNHIAVCSNDRTHTMPGVCADSDEDDDCKCDVCDRLMDHDFAPATCIAPKTCRVCEATEGEINPERHIGNSEVKTDEYREATCVSKEYTKYVTYCLGCDEAIETEEVEGEIDPDNHQKKQVVPNGGKDKVHYYICEREGCEYKENIEHNRSNATIVDQPTCTEKGRLREYCSICKSYIYSEIATIPHVDANKNAKCDVCNTTVELPEDPQPETPTPTPTPKPEDPSANCDCNCHKAGLQGLFFSIILLFQRLLGMNKKCICGVAHY